MGRLNKGATPTAGNNSDVFLKKEEKGSLIVLLVDKDGISSSDLQRTCFERNGAPCNASWIEVDNDPSKVLGDKIKARQTVVYIPVALNVGTAKAPKWEAKIWQTTKSMHLSILGLGETGWTIKGTQGRLFKNSQGRWEFSPTPVRPLSDAEVDALFAELPSDEELEKLTGPEDAEGVKAMLIKRCGVSDWNGVLKAFGVAVPDSDDEDL